MNVAFPRKVKKFLPGSWCQMDGIKYGMPLLFATSKTPKWLGDKTPPKPRKQSHPNEVFFFFWKMSDPKKWKSMSSWWLTDCNPGFFGTVDPIHSNFHHRLEEMWPSVNFCDRRRRAVILACQLCLQWRWALPCLGRRRICLSVASNSKRFCGVVTPQVKLEWHHIPICFQMVEVQ